MKIYQNFSPRFKDETIDLCNHVARRRYDEDLALHKTNDKNRETRGGTGAEENTGKVSGRSRRDHERSHAKAK